MWQRGLLLSSQASLSLTVQPDVSLPGAQGVGGHAPVDPRVLRAKPGDLQGGGPSVGGRAGAVAGRAGARAV